MSTLTELALCLECDIIYPNQPQLHPREPPMLNAIEVPKPMLPLGYPVMLMLRRALEEAQSFP